MTRKQDEITVDGFQEVLISVFNLDWCIAFYTEVFGYELYYRGWAADAQIDFWQLPSKTRIEEALLGNRGDDTGFIRLVKFHDIEQQQIRSSARSWDVGGIFDLNFRVLNIAERFEQFQQWNWNGLSDPQRYQFGEFDVSEVIVQGHDGIHFALIERHQPPLEGFPNLKTFSQVFNSSHICQDAKQTRRFFCEQLGFKTYMQVYSTDRPAAPNILGFPANVNKDLELDVTIVHPQGANIGSLEFIEIKGLEGSNFGGRSQPPNLGLLLYRFPVKGLAAYAEELVRKGIELDVPITKLNWDQIGAVEAFVIKSPDGLWLEFFEVASTNTN